MPVFLRPGSPEATRRAAEVIETVSASRLCRATALTHRMIRSRGPARCFYFIQYFLTW